MVENLLVASHGPQRVVRSLGELVQKVSRQNLTASLTPTIKIFCQKSRLFLCSTTTSLFVTFLNKGENEDMSDCHCLHGITSELARVYSGVLLK